MFPLKLRAFEELFYVDDHPDFPKVIHFIAKLDHELVHDRVLHATEFATSRHPLFRCLVEERNQSLYWIQSNQKLRVDQIQTSLDWKQSQSLRPIQLKEKPGLEIFFFRNEVMFRIHHAVADGRGILDFVRSWHEAYDGYSPTEKVDLSTDVIRDFNLRNRCRPGLSFFQILKLLPGQWKTIRAVFKMGGRKIVPFGRLTESPSKTNQCKSGSKVNPQTSPPRISFLSQSLEREKTTALIKKARECKTTVNNIAVVSLFRTLAFIQEKFQLPFQGSHYRMMIPVDERTNYSALHSACNHCTMVNLDRTPEEVSDLEKLVSSVNQEMGVIRKWKLSLNFWRALEATRYLSGGIEKEVKQEKCQATCVLTNLGDLTPSKKNDSRLPLELQDVQFWGPIRPETHFIIILYSYKNQIRANMSYDNVAMSNSLAKETLNRFLSTMESLPVCSI